MTTDKYRVGLVRVAITLLMVTAIIIYAAYLIQAIHAGRALYADGANFFVELLSKKSSWPVADDSKHIRLFANILNQFPVVFAIKSGVTNLQTLKIFFGAGLFLTPLCFYLYCFYLSRRANDYRVFYFSIVSLVTCAIPSDMFILNQAFTSLAISWILIHYLLLNLKVKWFDWAIFSAISLFLFRSHESLIVWGGVFFVGALCVIFFRERGVVNNKNLLIYTAGVLGILQSLFVIFWQYSHPVGEQTSAFLQLISLLKPAEIWVGNTRISLLITIALLLLFAVQLSFNRMPSGWKKLRAFALIGLFLMLGWMLVTGISSLNDFSLTDPVREYDYRFLMTFGSSGWMLLAIAFVLLNKSLNHKVKSLSIIIVCMGVISASLWQISNNLQWSIFVNATSQILKNSSESEIEPLEVRKLLATAGNEDVYKYRWGWAWPVFGMSLQKGWEVEKIYKPEGYDMYFNPPKRIPFIPMSGGEIGSEGTGLFHFDRFATSTKGSL
ncbi:hypothetical protein [Pantoea piersonii]|uniref:hypothetical protein n=1 Tax=Pantoea piersonii TaxID=2364647 RepID=UPI00289789B0|nr:hypothetical protein [Pantoea piersonii]